MISISQLRKLRNLPLYKDAISALNLKLIEGEIKLSLYIFSLLMIWPENMKYFKNHIFKWIRNSLTSDKCNNLPLPAFLFSSCCVPINYVGRVCLICFLWYIELSSLKNISYTLVVSFRKLPKKCPKHGDRLLIEWPKLQFFSSQIDDTHKVTTCNSEEANFLK